MNRTRPDALTAVTVVVLLCSAVGLLPVSAGETTARAAGVAPSSASVFETIKELAGTWEGKSTKGWTEEVTIKSIAGGSVVVMNSFDAHPGQEMLTTYYLDGDDLQLKHYCVAGNQPRLAVTRIADGGREVTFAFKDATNLASRDKGHMDKVVYRFQDKDKFSSKWTWYQDGAESWMEEIQYRRVR